MAILGHGEGEIGRLGVGGVAADNYALDWAILGHGEGEMGWVGWRWIIML